MGEKYSDFLKRGKYSGINMGPTFAKSRYHLKIIKLSLKLKAEINILKPNLFIYVNSEKFFKNRKDFLTRQTKTLFSNN